MATNLELAHDGGDFLLQCLVCNLAPSYIDFVAHKDHRHLK